MGDLEQAIGRDEGFPRLVDLPLRFKLAALREVTLRGPHEAVRPVVPIHRLDGGDRLLNICRLHFGGGAALGFARGALDDFFLEFFEGAGGDLIHRHGAGHGEGGREGEADEGRARSIPQP